MTDKCTSPKGHNLRLKVNDAGRVVATCLHCDYWLTDLSVEHDLNTLASLTEKVERYADVLDDIVRWSKAYPLEVFPEPDLKKAHEILKANGMTLDAISASSMRHVVTEVGKMADNAILESE